MAEVGSATAYDGSEIAAVGAGVDRGEEKAREAIKSGGGGVVVKVSEGSGEKATERAFDSR